MELMISRQDPARIFHGTRPATLDAVRSKLLLTSGWSAISAAPDLRKINRNKFNPKVARCLREPNHGLQQVLLGRFIDTREPYDPRAGRASSSIAPALVQPLNKLENQQVL